MEFGFGIRVCLRISSIFVFICRRLRPAIASQIQFDIFDVVCFSTRYRVGNVRVDEKFAAIASRTFGKHDFCGC